MNNIFAKNILIHIKEDSSFIEQNWIDPLSKQCINWLTQTEEVINWIETKKLHRFKNQESSNIMFIVCC